MSGDDKTIQNILMERIYDEVPLAGKNPHQFMGFITGIQMGVHLCREHHGDMEKWWTCMEAGLRSEHTKEKVAQDNRRDGDRRTPEEIIDSAMNSFYRSADKMLEIARSVDGAL